MLDNISSHAAFPVDKARLFYSDPRVHSRDSGQKRLSQLFLAIEREEVWRVRELLGSRYSKKIPINSIRRGISPLHFAAHCEHGNREIIHYLLQAGADRNNRDHFGKTPLDYASHPKVKALLTKAKEHNVTSRSKSEKDYVLSHYSQTELHMAIVKGDYSEFMRLIHTPQLNMRDKDNWTPLHYAVSCGRDYFVEKLLENNAQVDPMDKNKQTPLSIAISQKKCEVCLLFALYEADFNTLDDSGRTPLYHVVQWGNSVVLESFLKNGANPNLGANYDLKPIFMAFKKDSFLSLSILLEYGANLNEKDDQGQTLINYAINNRSLEWVRYLISKKAELNTLDKLGCTPLYYAAEQGGTAILEALLLNSANPNLGACNQLKPLFKAYEQDCLASAKLLIDHGTDIFAKDDTGHTLLEHIQEYHTQKEAKK